MTGQRFGKSLTLYTIRELIRELAALKGKVVLLIDEYDKPLIDYLEKDDLPTAFERQRILKNFYSIIKSADPYLEFLLITGVSKFSKVSVFSDLNDLKTSEQIFESYTPDNLDIRSLLFQSGY